MRAAALVVAVGVAFALVTAQSVSVARTADIAAARQPLTPDAAAVRCFGVQCPVLPPMGSRGGLPLTQPQVQALSLSSAEQQQPLQRPAAKPFLPPPNSPADSLSTHHLQVQSDAQPQQPAAASAQQPSSAFAEQLQKLQPQLQSAGQRVQQFGQSAGERMQSFGKTIAGLGGGTGGSGGGGGDKTDANAKAKADADIRANTNANANAGGGVDSAQMPLSAQSQQQMMQPLQPLQQPMAMPQSPLRDAKMEAALARGNLEPLTVVQPNANANANARGIAAAPNTISAAGTGTRFVRDEQPALLGRPTAAAAAAESEGHGGGFGFGGGAIVAAVPTPVTNVLPAVAPVVPAIPIPPPPPPPVAPVATLAAVPVAVPICPHGHCH